MKKKTMFDEPCRDCGAMFGNDGRSFRFEKDKKPICFDCEIKRMPKKALVIALSILAKDQFMRNYEDLFVVLFVSIFVAYCLVILLPKLIGGLL